MENTDQTLSEEEIERLRDALDSETLRCLEVQRRLDRANAEFEEFMLMTAHDLREHLRVVASFGQLMAETWAGRLDSDSEVFLGRIQDGASRAQSLLSDVVDYWAPSIGDWQSSRTDMEAALRQALLCTNRQITERGATVTHDSLPAVMGDFGILARVLRHLIGNAIEYCDAPRPRVHVSFRREGTSWVFSVQDNGPGIDPEFQGRVFGAFKRLHGKDHPGNGLGLAFCRKAIEWHGGRITMESAPGAGSTFFFTLPAAD
jgi:light-regulated signal transduction histidine kinase (bacteriophytochrome)